MKVNRERQLVWEYQSYFSKPDYTKLADLLTEVKTLIKEYGPDAEVRSYYEMHSDNAYYGVYAKVPESDEKYNARIAEEDKRAAEAEERDRAEFERLQKKFQGSK